MRKAPSGHSGVSFSVLRWPWRCYRLAARGTTVYNPLMRTMRLLITVTILALAPAACFAQPAPTSAPSTRPTGFARWEKEISAYEQQDRANPPPKGALLFTGASTIRMWKSLAADFPEQKVINRGFGGSQIADVTHFADRIIFPYEPKMIFFPSGGDHINAGKTVEQGLADYKKIAT